MRFCTDNTISKLIVKLCLLLLIIGLSDVVLGGIIDYVATKKLIGYHGFKSVVEQKPDIVILGASRAACHYDAPRIKRETGMSVFNFGLGGTGCIVHYSQLYELLQVYKPKLIIYEIYGRDYWDYFLNLSSINVLLDYPGSKEIDYAFMLSDEFYWLKKRLKLYKYNKDVFRILLSLTKSSTKFTTLGYTPIKKASLPDLLEMNTISPPDKQKYQDSVFLQNMFSEMLDLIDNNKVRVVFFRSPFYHDENSNIPESIDSSVKDVIDQHGFDIYDYSCLQNGKFNDPSYYKDYIHLTSKGAEAYTDMIIPIIVSKAEN